MSKVPTLNHSTINYLPKYTPYLFMLFDTNVLYNVEVLAFCWITFAVHNKRASFSEGTAVFTEHDVLLKIKTIFCLQITLIKDSIAAFGLLYFKIELVSI